MGNFRWLAVRPGLLRLESVPKRPLCRGASGECGLCCALEMVYPPRGSLARVSEGGATLLSLRASVIASRVRYSMGYDLRRLSYGRHRCSAVALPFGLRWLLTCHLANAPGFSARKSGAFVFAKGRGCRMRFRYFAMSLSSFRARTLTLL